MRSLLYIAVVVSVLLPLVFRSRYGVRVACVVALFCFGLLHWTALMTLHRVVLERGYQRFGVASGEALPDDFKVAVGMVQELSQGEMPFVFLLVVAFAVLAILPFRQGGKREDKS